MTEVSHQEPSLTLPYPDVFAQMRAGLERFEQVRKKSREAGAPVVEQDVAEGVLLGMGEAACDALEWTSRMLKATAYAALSRNNDQRDQGLNALTDEAKGVLLALSNKEVLLAVVKNATEGMIPAMDSALEKGDYRDLSHLAGGLMLGISWRNIFKPSHLVSADAPSALERVNLKHDFQTESLDGTTVHQITLSDLDREGREVGYMRYHVLDSDADKNPTAIFIRNYRINDDYLGRRLSDELFRGVLERNPQAVAFHGELGTENLAAYKRLGIESTPWAKSMNRLGLQTSENIEGFHTDRNRTSRISGVYVESRLLPQVTDIDR